MEKVFRTSAALFAASVMTFGLACSIRNDNSGAGEPLAAPVPQASTSQADIPPASVIPNLQAEILDDRNKQTSSPIAIFDFRNFTYPLPRGWQNPDNADLTLTNGRLAPVAVDTDLGMDPDEAAEKKSRRRIGGSYVTTKFLDATGDGQDEALVILKIETTGSAIPQIVYIYEWKDASPNLIWYFRTGDRADGGLKDLRIENGELVVELYGQDRFLLGEAETAKITDDEEQLCCPLFFTRTRYKWNGKNFQLQGKRLTFSVADSSSPPVENMMELVEKESKQKGRK